MSWSTKVCIALFGIAVGIVVVFAIDMVFNSGKFVAHAVHVDHPGCSGGCHARQDFESAAAQLALPYLQSPARPFDPAPGPWRDSLLGVQMETGGSL